MVVGNEEYDWKALELNCEYKNGYTSSDETVSYKQKLYYNIITNIIFQVKWFWEVFHDLPLAEKKKFLLYLTGSDRIPIQGMKAIKVTKTYNFLIQFYINYKNLFYRFAYNPQMMINFCRWLIPVLISQICRVTIQKNVLNINFYRLYNKLRVLVLYNKAAIHLNISILFIYPSIYKDHLFKLKAFYIKNYNLKWLAAVTLSFVLLNIFLNSTLITYAKIIIQIF